MKFTRPMFLVFAAAACTSSAYAAETSQQAGKLNVRPAVQQVRAGQPVKAGAAATGYTDFDALNSVNDPLYIKGTQELLKQSAKPEQAKQPELRDALNSRPENLLKKPRARKQLPADPVKTKNTL